MGIINNAITISYNFKITIVDKGELVFFSMSSIYVV